MNGIKTGLGITPGEHIISADSALSRNIRHCFCLSCHGRLILQTDAQGAWFEHDLHALSDQQKSDCVVLNPEKTTPATCVAVHSDTIRNTTLNFPGLNTLTTG